MQDTLPFFDVFVFPTDAGTGQRFEIDGINGAIRFYNNLNQLIGEWNLSHLTIYQGSTGTYIRIDPEDTDDPLLRPVLLFETGDIDAESRGSITGYASGVGGARTLGLQFGSPGFQVDGSDRWNVRFASPSQDGVTTPEPRATFGMSGGGKTILTLSLDDVIIDTPELSLVNSVSGISEIRIEGPNGITNLLGRGITEQNEFFINNGPHASNATTDFAFNDMPVISGHRYKFTVDSQVVVSAGGGAWVLDLRRDGVIANRRFGLFGQGTFNLGKSVYWTAPATTTHDFDVRAVELIGGSTIELQAAADAPRWFTAEDMGT